MAFISNAEGNFFMQEERNDVPTWLTCTGVGDIEIPEAELTPHYCPDPLNSGDFKIDGFTKGDKDMGTYGLNKPLTTVYNALIEAKCPFAGRVNWVCRGLRMDPRNYEVAVIMPESHPNRRSISNVGRGAADTEDKVMTGLDLNFPDALMLYHLTTVRQSLSNTLDANDIYFLPWRCKDRCGPARGVCEVGGMALEGGGYLGGYLYAYDSEIKLTTNYGATWSAAAVDPFTWGGSSSAIHIFETASGYRVLAFRGTQVPGAPAECAYSDDWGVTWTNRTIGTINGQAVLDYALCGAKIVVCCTAGYIYESLNQGESWTVQEAGVETVQNLNAIEFWNDQIGYCAGNANAFLYTLNGGVDWASGVGPAALAALLSVSVTDVGDVVVGTNDARIFRSEDGDTGGAPWIETVDFGGGTVPWIEFDPTARYIGAAIWNTTAPRGWLYRSENGGADWVRVPNMPNNNGLFGGHMCDQNYIYTVGDIMGGTTFVARTQPIG